MSPAHYVVAYNYSGKGPLYDSTHRWLRQMSSLLLAWYYYIYQSTLEAATCDLTRTWPRRTHSVAYITSYGRLHWTRPSSKDDWVLCVKEYICLKFTYISEKPENVTVCTVSSAIVTSMQKQKISLDAHMVYTNKRWMAWLEAQTHESWLRYRFNESVKQTSELRLRHKKCWWTWMWTPVLQFTV